MSHLDDMPTLKMYSLAGPAQFTYDEIVWIRIQETKDAQDVVTKLLDWLSAAKIYTQPFGGACGGGYFSYGFRPEDAPLVKAWLVGFGVVEES